MIDYSVFYEAIRCGKITRRTSSKDGNTFLVQDGKTITGCESVYDIEETLVPEPVFVLFGAGHVGKSVYDLAVLSGIECIVIDDRPSLLIEERFPRAERIISPFDEALKREYASCPCYLIFTHGHSYDLECLRYALMHKSLYVGMIGSKGKVAYQKKILKDEGFRDEAISSIHSPIGLSINAVTPEEIAIAIMAEVISVLRADKEAVRVDARLIKAMSEEDGIEVRIIDKKGSSPRDRGASMFVMKDRVLSTIGGGSVENLAIEEARRMLSSAESTMIKHYDLREGGDAGMICGGALTLLFSRICH